MKADMEKAIEHWERFWRGEHPQPLIGSVIPKEELEPVPKPSTYALGPGLDIEAFAEQVVQWAETHEFFGAAIPFVYVEFAADQFSTFLGVDLEFPNPGEGGWPVHTHADCPISEVHVTFDRSGKWWQLVERICEAVRRRGDDGVLVASPSLVANLDCLVALRGAQTVLWDLVDSPAEVKRVLAEITAAHGQILSAFGEVLDYPALGSINRHGMYGTGPINVPQCDFSCMISPEMFDEFVMPCLEKEFARFGGGEYHLDGANAIRHLESLARLDDLHVVQWVAGAGDTRGDWSDLYRQIDALGKGQIRWGNREQLDQWAQELTAGRLYWAGMHGADRRAIEKALEDYGW